MGAGAALDARGCLGARGVPARASRSPLATSANSSKIRALPSRYFDSSSANWAPRSSSNAASPGVRRSGGEMKAPVSSATSMLVSEISPLNPLMPPLLLAVPPPKPRPPPPLSPMGMVRSAPRSSASNSRARSGETGLCPCLAALQSSRIAISCARISCPHAARCTSARSSSALISASTLVISAPDGPSSLAGSETVATMAAPSTPPPIASDLPLLGRVLIGRPLPPQSNRPLPRPTALSALVEPPAVPLAEPILLAATPLLADGRSCAAGSSSHREASSCARSFNSCRCTFSQSCLCAAATAFAFLLELEEKSSAICASRAAPSALLASILARIAAVELPREACARRAADGFGRFDIWRRRERSDWRPPRRSIACTAQPLLFNSPTLSVLFSYSRVE
eukprot:scaffold244627_cov26-Tisochrysis_lutea.AAC.1